MDSYKDKVTASQPLMKDAASFIDYVHESKGLRLTQVSKNLSLKDVRAINGLFVQPEELDNRIGDHLYKLQNEDEAQRVHFIRCLCQTAGLVKKRGGRLTSTKRAIDFLKGLPFEQINFLFGKWWREDDWGRFMRWAELADLCQEQAGYIASVLRELPVGTEVPYELFAENLSSVIGYVIDKDVAKDKHLTNLVIERTVIYPLEIFGALKVKNKKEKYGSKLVSFSITTLGESLFEQLAVDYGLYNDAVVNVDFSAKRRGS